MNKEELFAKAREVDEAFRLDPKARREYQILKLAEIDYKADLAAARQRSIQKVCLNAAKSMLKLNMPLEQIAQVSQLSLEQIRQLQAQSEPELTN